MLVHYQRQQSTNGQLYQGAFLLVLPVYYKVQLLGGYIFAHPLYRVVGTVRAIRVCLTCKPYSPMHFVYRQSNSRTHVITHAIKSIITL